MNPILTDYNNPSVPPAACNVDDDQIADDMRVSFNHGLFRDIGDLWERENSQRQFYTMPNTAIPNNQKEVAMWLYGVPNQRVCKQEGQACLKYVDLRRER